MNKPAAQHFEEAYVASLPAGITLSDQRMKAAASKVYKMSVALISKT